MEARLERSRFTSNTKAVLKDFLKAARNGLQQRDCAAIYYKCPVAVMPASRSEKGKMDGPKTENVSTPMKSPHNWYADLKFKNAVDLQTYLDYFRQTDIVFLNIVNCYILNEN